jgi:hypothetical protein
MENQKFENIRERYVTIQQKKNIRERDLESLKMEIDGINHELSELKWLVDPHVSISKISSSSQKDRYIGKFMVYIDDEKSKQVSVSLGNTEKYKGVEDPVLLDYSKEKAIEYMLNKYPEKYK